MLFLVLAWRNGSFVSEIFFCLLLPGVLGFGSVRHESCRTTNFLISFFRWREEGATSVLGSQPIVWLLPSSPWSGDFFGLLDVTQVQTSGLHCDPHSFLMVILWWLATVNSNTRIVVIIFQSSQWDTTWQYHLTHS